MALIGIQGFPVAHGKNNEGGGGGTTIINGGSASIPSDLNLNSITASQGSIRSLSGIDLEYNDALFKYASAEDAQINKLRGNEINYAKGRIADIQSDTTKTGSLTADEMSSIKGYVKSLLSDNITTEYLNVTKQAHFFELIVDKIRAVGGTLLMTQAQAVADYVKAGKKVNGKDVYIDLDDEQNTEFYDVFFLAQKNDDDHNTRKISNDWIEGDQAYCQSFNNVAPNVPNYNVTNKYYWRLVTAKLDDRYLNLDTGEEVTFEDIAEAEQNDEPNPTEWNKVTINSPSIMYTDSGSHTTILRNCRVDAQSGGEVIWDLTHAYEDQTGERYVAGDMYTQNTDEGIKIVFSDISIPEQAYFSVGCSSARLNITVYYLDGGSEFFPASTNRQTSHGGTLTNGSGVEKIVITNADTVQLKLVHGIRLSNKPGECDKSFPVPTSDVRYINTASIPSKGDNLAQLGYRWTQGDTNEKSRGNAIIIAAYKSPDAGCQSSIMGEHFDPIVPPSYAQYEAIGSDSNHYFDLAYYRKTYMDGTGSKFFGQFYAISQGPQGQQATPIGATNVYTAYATKDDKSDMTLTPNPNVAYEYIGICITNSPTAPLTPASYEWSKISDVKYKLVDQGSTAYTRLYKDGDDWKKQLSISLAYKIMRFEGTSTSYLTVGEVRNWPQYNNYGYISKTPTTSSPGPSRTNYTGFFPYAKYTKGSSSSARPYYYQFLISNDNNDHTHDSQEAVLTSSFSSTTNATTANGEDNPNPNITNNKEIMVVLANVGVMSIPWDPGYQNDVQYFEPDAIFYSASATPSSPPVKILDIIQDSVTVKVAPESASYLSVMNDQILMSSGNAEQISQLSIGVQDIRTDCFGPQGLQSQMVQTAAGIQSQVTSGIQGVQSQMTQTATGIQAEIWGPQGVQGKLQRTGVDITNGNINLQADKVTFSSSSTGTQGVQSGKVWIDSNYGTLHAVNGDFSGKVTANLVYSPTIYLLQSGGTQLKHTINPETDATPFYYCETIDQYIKIMLPKIDVPYDGIELSFYVKQGRDMHGVLVYQNSGEGSGFRTITGRKWATMTSIENLQFEAPLTSYESNPSNPSMGNPFYATSVILGFNQVVTFKQIGGSWYVITGKTTANAPENW